MFSYPTKSPALELVLQTVRNTGRSAHPQRGEAVSDVVMAVAVERDLNPVELQAEVEAWSAALDSF